MYTLEGRKRREGGREGGGGGRKGGHEEGTHVGFVAAETFVKDVVFPELFLHLVEIAGDEGHVVHIGQGLLEMLWGERTSGRVRGGKGGRKRRREEGKKGKKGGGEEREERRG